MGKAFEKLLRTKKFWLLIVLIPVVIEIIYTHFDLIVPLYVSSGLLYWVNLFLNEEFLYAIFMFPLSIIFWILFGYMLTKLEKIPSSWLLTFLLIWIIMIVGNILLIYEGLKNVA